MSPCTVTELSIFPIKSCRGVPVDSIEIRKAGIVGDRELMLVRDGEPLVQLEEPGMARIAAQPLPDGRIRITHPEAGEYVHEIQREGHDVAAKLVFNDIETRDQGDEAAAWFEAALKKPARLVSLPQPWNRWIPLPEFALVDGKPQGAFFNAAPVLLNNQDSLDELNGRLDEPVGMDRFRSNLVVDGLGPYGEDEIKSVSSGSVELLRATVCERCIMIATDQVTGERGKEPLATLATYRKREDKYGSGVMFGAYMAVASEGRLRIGDPLDVTR
jgi:uncharacterized protein YcbX